MGRPGFPIAIVLSILGSSMLGNARQVVARPADVFQPYLAQIRQELPPNQAIRLPAEVLLGGPGHLDPTDLIVRILSSSTPSRLTISLLTCDNGPYPCLVGSFAAESMTSATAQRELRRHQAMKTPITLTNGVEGYLQEGTSLNPPSDFSSVMWQQDGMIYTVSFLAAERQNILYMARSMATEPPLLSLQPATTSSP